MDDSASRIAVVSIIVENPAVSEEINRILHEYSRYIIGRLGLPCRDRGVCVIVVVVDAPEPLIGALSGKLGMLKNISVKTVFSKK